MSIQWIRSTKKGKYLIFIQLVKSWSWWCWTHKSIRLNMSICYLIRTPVFMFPSTFGPYKRYVWGVALKHNTFSIKPKFWLVRDLYIFVQNPTIRNRPIMNDLHILFVVFIQFLLCLYLTIDLILTILTNFLFYNIYLCFTT